jgi:uncharacterized protein YgfB (UPF0149 family)
MIIFGWINHRFAHIGITTEMHDSLDSVCPEAVPKLFFVGQIAKKEFTPFYELAVSVNKVVEHDSFITMLAQEFVGVRTNITRTTCN